MSIDMVIERFTTFHLSKTKTAYLHNYQNLNFLEFFQQPNKAINHKKLPKSQPDKKKKYIYIYVYQYISIHT